MKEKVTVGNAAMFAKTIPVNLVFNEIYETPELANGMVGERFKIIEVDGVYIVIHESIMDTSPSIQEFKAFLLKDDAVTYLELLGVDLSE